MKSLLLFLFIFVCLFIFHEVRAGEEYEGGEKKVISISVEKSQIKDGAGEIITCPYCGKILQIGHIRKDGEYTLLAQLKDALDSRGVEYVENNRRDIHLNLYLFRFVERQGGNLAVERPASVGFHLHLIEHDKLKEVFIFDEEQRPLLEDILALRKFFRRGMKWVTVDVLSEEGVDKGVDVLKGSLR